MPEAGPDVVDGLDRAVVEQIAPAFRRLRAYARLEVEGLDRVPKGPVVVVANHTGWLGLDYGLLALVLWDDAGRALRCAAHPTFFRLPAVRPWAEKLGLYEASVGATLEVLRKGHATCFFPEGDEGNFKPVTERYRLQPFKPGFARAALAARVPVLPVVIVGGEDANPSLKRIDALRPATGLSLPLPLNLVPFPVKWRIAFMEPIDPDQVLKRAEVDQDVPLEFANELRASMQRELDRQLVKRGNPFF